MPRTAERFLVAILALAPATASAEGWRTYANDRFGTTVEYPSLLSRLDPPPANSDGQGFRTPDGRVRLLVYGSFNVENQTAREMMEARRDKDVSYSYTRATARFFVLSGRRGDSVVYVRCAISEKAQDIVGCFDIAYPESEAAAWTARVERIGRSLRFGTHW